MYVIALGIGVGGRPGVGVGVGLAFVCISQQCAAPEAVGADGVRAGALAALLLLEIRKNKSELLSRLKG